MAALREPFAKGDHLRGACTVGSRLGATQLSQVFSPSGSEHLGQVPPGPDATSSFYGSVCPHADKTGAARAPDPYAALR